MGIFDYIFKSKEQREEEAKAAEEKRIAQLSSKASDLYKAEKYDECLTICLELINQHKIDRFYSNIYLYAAEILYKTKRYKEVIEVSKHYDWLWDRDSDRYMNWYVSYSNIALEEQEKPKSVPKPQPNPAPSSKPKPSPVPKPVTKPKEQEPPKPEVHVPKWDDDEQDEPEDMKTFLPPARPIGSMVKSKTLYWQLMQAKKDLPPFELLGMPEDLPQGAVDKINRIKSEAQGLLDRAKAYMRQDDLRGAANLYENLLMNKYWEDTPYYALIDIYEKLGRHRDAQAVRQEGLYNLRNVQRRMKNELLEAAKKIDAESLALDIMKKEEKVVYGLGLYTVYDPFPCIEQWESELKYYS